MAKKLVGVADDDLANIYLHDFTGGLNTYSSPYELASNESPSLQNCFAVPGRLQYCGGYTRECTIPFQADAGWEFYDNNGARHEVVWAGGNVYDVAGASPILITSGKYTPGQQIGMQDLGGVLYWTAKGVPLRMWNALTNTEAAVIGSGLAGSVNPPSGTTLTAFAGSLIMGNVTVSGIYYPGGFMYANVNDPTTWIGANINQLGANEFIQWIIPLGVSAVGVPPSGGFMIGCNTVIFYYEGPLNSLTQKIVNCPVGALDANSAYYVPSKDLYPGVFFLGSDFQFWRTNGIVTECISLKIQNLCSTSLTTTLQSNPFQKFFGSYNATDHYYICDIGGNQQFAYRWSESAWYTFSGWPSGPLINGHDQSGFNALFSAGGPSGSALGFFELGQVGVNFAGSYPNIFYQTAYLHGGDPGLQKDFQWVELDTLNNTAAYNLYGQSIPNASNTVLYTQEFIFTTPFFNQGFDTGVWDQDNWNNFDWSGVVATATGTPVTNHGMLSVLVPAGEWVPRATTQPFRTPAASFTIQSNVILTDGAIGIPYFDVCGFKTRFVPRGRKTVGGQLYTSQSGSLNFSSPTPYSQTGNQP